MLEPTAITATASTQVQDWITDKKLRNTDQLNHFKLTEYTMYR